MATLADLPLGATVLIPVGTEENRLCEIADKDNLVSSGAVLVYKNAYEKSEFGSSNLYPNETLDNLIKIQYSTVSRKRCAKNDRYYIRSQRQR